MNKKLIWLGILLAIILFLSFYKLQTTDEYLPEGYVSKYEDFVQAVANMEDHYSLKVGEGTPREMFDEVWIMHPEIFWLRNRFAYRTIDGYYEINLHYNCPKFVAKIRQIIFNIKVNSIVKKAQQQPNKTETLRYIHDYLKEKSQYTKITQECSTAYGCIIEGQSLCQGYTNAMTILARKCGIVCGPVHNADHVWNYVVVDGKETMIDLTWDDAKGVRNSTPYRYFMITKEEMAADHVIGTDYYDLSVASNKRK